MLGVRAPPLERLNAGRRQSKGLLMPPHPITTNTLLYGDTFAILREHIAGEREALCPR